MFKSDLSLLLALDGSRDVSIRTRSMTMNAIMIIIISRPKTLKTSIVPLTRFQKTFRTRFSLSQGNDVVVVVVDITRRHLRP